MGDDMAGACPAGVRPAGADPCADISGQLAALLHNGTASGTDPVGGLLRARLWDFCGAASQARAADLVVALGTALGAEPGGMAAPHPALRSLAGCLAEQARTERGHRLLTELSDDLRSGARESEPSPASRTLGRLAANIELLLYAGSDEAGSDDGNGVEVSNGAENGAGSGSCERGRDQAIAEVVERQAPVLTAGLQARLAAVVEQYPEHQDLVDAVRGLLELLFREPHLVRMPPPMSGGGGPRPQPMDQNEKRSQATAVIGSLERAVAPGSDQEVVIGRRCSLHERLCEFYRDPPLYSPDEDWARHVAVVREWCRRSAEELGAQLLDEHYTVQLYASGQVATTLHWIVRPTWTFNGQAHAGRLLEIRPDHGAGGGWTGQLPVP